MGGGVVSRERMTATLYLDEPLGEDDTEIDCKEARIRGDVVWLTPTDGSRETVVPLANVTGLRGDDVDQEIDEIESPGGRFTELVTSLS